MQTNADRSKEYVAVEKEYVAVEKEIQKHPHQGSLGGRERTRREGESRRQVEKEVEKEYLAVEQEIKKEHVAVEKHSMHRASRQKQHLENLVPTRFRRDGPSPSGRRPSTQSIELCKRNEFAFFLLEAKGCVTNLKSNEVFVAVLSPRHQRSGRDPA